MSGIIAAGRIKMVESQNNLSGPENTSSLRQPKETLCLSGENSSIDPANRGSIAPYLETSPKNSQATLSVRRTPLLISAGLVKGTTLTFGRRLFDLGIRDFVSYAPDGIAVDIRKAGYLF